jgi:hypothetical protein
MPAPRGGKKPGDRRAGKPLKKRGAAPRRPSLSRPVLADDSEIDGIEPRPFRGGPEYRVESTAGLRHEIIDLRAEVQRLAAEIDKLWARERGRGAAAPGRTARSIAGKPVRTGTRASRPAARAGSPPGAGVKRAGPGSPVRKTTTSRGGPSGAKRAGGGNAKRAGGVKRSSGWAKPKTGSRRSGTTPRRRGR